MKNRVLLYVSCCMLAGALAIVRSDYVDSYALSKLSFLKEPALLYRLGECYFYGTGQPRDLIQAEYYYREAAERGHAKAMYKLGNLYSHRYGMQHGHECDEEFWLGIPLDYEKAIKMYRYSAEKGYVSAYVRLGFFNLVGVGGPVDYRRSFYWYRKGAKAGSKKAQAWLGFFYTHGLDRECDCQNAPENCWDGIELNYAKALKWYERSAKKGLRVALYMTGFLYANGEECLGKGPRIQSIAPVVFPGVPLDYEKAALWYRASIKRECLPGLRRLAYLYYRGTYATPQDLERAFKLYTKAAYCGDVVSMRRVGSCYEDGTGVERNEALAIEWYIKAADRGDVVAESYIKEKAEFWIEDTDNLIKQCDSTAF